MSGSSGELYVTSVADALTVSSKILVSSQSSSSLTNVGTTTSTYSTSAWAVRTELPNPNMARTATSASAGNSPLLNTAFKCVSLQLVLSTIRPKSQAQTDP